MKQDTSETENPEKDLYYNMDDSESPTTESESAQKQKHTTRNPWLLLFKLLVTPIEGWKSIRRAKRTAAEWSRECFYPLTGFCALTSLASVIYDHDVTWNVAVIHSIIAFMSFLLSYFCTLLCADIFLPQIRKEIHSDFGKIFVMTAISTMGVAYCLWNLLPMLSPLLAFVPIYTIYLVIRGVRFLRIKGDKTGNITVAMCIFIVGLPLVLYYLFDDFIPK